jgi:uncharacterized BrkB/YihY/UPF0761 family membrane protein
VLRVFNRFQKVAGFDRAIALASGALTATIPLAIVTSAIASPARRHANRLLWIGGLALYLAASGFLHTTLGRSQLELSAALLSTPVTVIFIAWSGRVLSVNRIARPDLMPFAILGALLLAAYSVAATVYVPHLFDTFATCYGVVGAVFAMISALFCVMVVLVGSAAAGREVNDELDRIRRGEKPAEDEVRRQWTSSPPRHDHGGTCCEPRSTTAAVATATERAPSSSILDQRVPTFVRSGRCHPSRNPRW